MADKIPGGLADNKKPEDFDQEALAEGIKVEMEHTSDKQIATEICMDHLTEDKDYYKKLKTIEKSEDLEKVTDYNIDNDKVSLSTYPHISKIVKKNPLPGNMEHVVKVDPKNPKDITHTLHKKGISHPLAQMHVEMRHHDDTEATEPTVSHSVVHPKHRGKGLGKLLYQQAIKHHGSLTSDSSISSNAHKMWGKLNSKKEGIHTELADRNDYDETPHRASFYKSEIDQLFDTIETVIEKSGESFVFTIDTSLFNEDLTKNNLDRPPRFVGDIHPDPDKAHVGVMHPNGTLMWHSNPGRAAFHDKFINNPKNRQMVLDRMKSPYHKKVMSAVMNQISKDPNRHFIPSEEGGKQKLRARHIKDLIHNSSNVRVKEDHPSELHIERDSHSQGHHKNETITLRYEGEVKSGAPIKKTDGIYGPGTDESLEILWWRNTPSIVCEGSGLCVGENTISSGPGATEYSSGENRDRFGIEKSDTKFVQLLKIAKVLHEENLEKVDKKPIKADLADAFHVSQTHMEPEDHKDFQAKWDKSIKSGKIKKIPIHEAAKYNFADNGRSNSIPKSSVNNPIIVAEVSPGSHVVLDGNHRLIHHMKSGSSHINVFHIKAPHLSDLKDMQGSDASDYLKKPVKKSEEFNKTFDPKLKEFWDKENAKPPVFPKPAKDYSNKAKKEPKKSPPRTQSFGIKPNLTKDEELSKPYVSDAQRRWAHTEAGKEALGAETVAHYDKESKGKDLPEKVTKMAMASHAALNSPNMAVGGAALSLNQMKEKEDHKTFIDSVPPKKKELFSKIKSQIDKLKNKVK